MVMITMAMAPMTVPTMRKDALRRVAPRLGWQTIAAVVAAHVGLSSSSQNARKEARHTEAHKRNPNRMGRWAARAAVIRRSTSEPAEYVEPVASSPEELT
jgi:hypothetical protein